MVIRIVAVIVAGLLFAAALFIPKSFPETVEETSPEMSRDTPPDNPVELGAVHWLRDLEQGLAQSRQTGKPVLILFQEVPGCGNCTRYGSVTLSNPRIVEAIETAFVPVCIYNNQGGKDALALKRFGEPSWNNPVVRIVRADGSDLTPRMTNFRSSWEIVHGMRRALEQTGAQVPETLTQLEADLFASEN